MDVHGFVHVYTWSWSHGPSASNFFSRQVTAGQKDAKKKKNKTNKTKHGGVPRLFSVTLVVGNPSASLLRLRNQPAAPPSVSFRERRDWDTPALYFELSACGRGVDRRWRPRARRRRWSSHRRGSSRRSALSSCSSRSSLSDASTTSARCVCMRRLLLSWIHSAILFDMVLYSISCSRPCR